MGTSAAKQLDSLLIEERMNGNWLGSAPPRRTALSVLAAPRRSASSSQNHSLSLPSSETGFASSEREASDLPEVYYGVDPRSGRVPKRLAFLG